MMSSLVDWCEDLCLSVIRVGGVPDHIGIIMDGNRRYAREHSLPSATGHTHGYLTLTRVLQWSLKVRVRAITVFAFSIDNFNRSAEEISDLLGLAQSRMSELSRRRGLIDTFGICVRIFGNVSFIKSEVRDSLARAVEYSRGQTRIHLNIAAAYTSSQELSDGARAVTDAVTAGELLADDITWKLLNQTLYTHSLHAQWRTPALLIRTSGECRLSDFLLYQAGSAHLAFLDVYWPDLNLAHFCHLLLDWQYTRLQTDARRQHDQAREHEYDTQVRRGHDMSDAAADNEHNRVHRFLHNKASHALL